MTVPTAVLALLGLIIGIVSTRSGTPRSNPRSTASPTPGATAASTAPGQTAAERWRAAIVKDFGPFSGSFVSTLRTIDAWDKGTGPASVVAQQIELTIPALADARRALAGQAPLPAAPRALGDYRTAADLYIASFRLAKVATSVSDQALRHQLVLSYIRVRDLGDRVLDLAEAMVQPLLPAAPSDPNLVIRKPADVPDWASMGIAAGPPLDAPHPSGSPAGYEANRPQQSFALWRTAVEGAGIPAAAAETAAIESGPAATARSLSDALTTAVARLTATADPAGERDVSTRLRLGLLVDGEAARTAQEAYTIAPTARGGLQTVAKTLALIGDRMWDERLGPRSTPFAASLLTQ